MIAYTNNVRGGKAYSCSPEELKRLRNLPNVIETAKSLSPVLSQGEGAIFSVDEEAKRKMKMNLPAIVPHAASFDNDERKSDKAHPSGFVFFDIDHYKGDLVALFEEKIHPHVEEWHVCEVERSIGGDGMHIIFQKPNGLTIPQAQKWMAENLGVEYDEATFDLARCCFVVPEDYVLYQNDEILFSPCPQPLSCSTAVRKRHPFGMPSAPLGARGVDTPSGENINTPEDNSTPVPQTKCNGARGVDIPSGENINTPEDNSTPLPRTECSGEREASQSDAGKGDVLPSSLAAFDLCVEQAGLDAQSLDTWGKHNWHSNLMAVLSVGLPKLMSKAQLFAVVKKRLPNYSEYPDCKALIDYFYEKYSADRGFMSTTLREINAKAQQAANEDEEAMAEMTRDWNPPTLPKKIPRIMQLLTGNFDPRFREMLMLSSLPILSAHASHFRASYLSGRLTPPQQYVAVIAGSGKGKGNCTRLFEQMCEHTLTAHDKMEWVKVAENAKLRDKKANAKDRPEKYHPQLRIFMTTSKSSMQELQNNCGENGMLMGMFSEVDELFNSNQQSYANLTVTLRKGWDGDLQMQYYLSDSTVCAQTRTNISLLMCGTPNAMLKRMLGDTESGFLQRCIPVIVPNMKRTFRPPKVDFLSHDELVERDALLMSLYQKDLSLGDDICELELPKTNAAIGKWFDELEEQYNDGKLTEAEADLSHRCGEFILRAAIPLVALEGEETKQIVDFALWVGRTAHYYLCQIFGSRVSQDIEEANRLLLPNNNLRCTAEPLLDQVPEIFTIQQMQEVRKNAGQSENVKMLLSRYCKNGKLKRVARGVYRKQKVT